MKTKALLLCIVVALTFSCDTKSGQQVSLSGTWELIAATSTEKGKTVSTFDPKRKMIKIINNTHFAFLNHDITAAGDSVAPFSAGGGKYTLNGKVYTEYLDYFTDKRWEGNKFEFTVDLHNDTLIQRGVEKVDKLDVDHILVETYRRVNQ